MGGFGTKNDLKIRAYKIVSALVVVVATVVVIYMVLAEFYMDTEQRQAIYYLEKAHQWQQDDALYHRIQTLTQEQEQERIEALSKIKIRDQFVLDFCYPNSGTDFVMERSGAERYYDYYQMKYENRLSITGLTPADIFEGIPETGITLDELVEMIKIRYGFKKVEYELNLSAFFVNEGGGDSFPFGNQDMNSIRIYIWANDTVLTTGYWDVERKYFDKEYPLILYVPIRLAYYSNIDSPAFSWRNTNEENVVSRVSPEIADKFRLFPDGGGHGETIIPDLYFYSSDVSGVEWGEGLRAAEKFRTYILNKNRELEGTNITETLVGGWRKRRDYWYYINPDGTTAVNTWIGDYYVGADGKMLTNTMTPDGYYVGADGKWIPGPDYTP